MFSTEKIKYSNVNRYRYKVNTGFVYILEITKFYFGKIKLRNEEIHYVHRLSLYGQRCLLLIHSFRGVTQLVPILQQNFYVVIDGQANTKMCVERPGCRITETFCRDWNVRRTALSSAVIQKGWPGGRASHRPCEHCQIILACLE